MELSGSLELPGSSFQALSLAACDAHRKEHVGDLGKEPAEPADHQQCNERLDFEHHPIELRFPGQPLKRR